MMKSKAFTLIELLIVMAVIAILIAIAIPSFRGMQTEARQTKAQGDTRVLKIAVESYYKNHNNVYPVATTTATQTWEAMLTGAIPRVLDAVLYDPFGATTTSQYWYATDTNSTSTAKYYIIYSQGVDGLGTAAVATDGTITASGDVIYDSNGH